MLKININTSELVKRKLDYEKYFPYCGTMSHFEAGDDNKTEVGEYFIIRAKVKPRG